ncbi:MAG: NFACT family protein, partial [Candidatus Eremiobacteraeota bacterium]|nr:NFACT family protein [Candidatus Eremiobacteraeota bacterium]
MLTDWLIVRRMAAELDRRVRGARIRGAGVLADGRFAVQTTAGTLVLDAFGATPAVLLRDDGEVTATAGWPRAADGALATLRIESIRARRGDRLVAFECASRSRFGVSSGYRLVAELVPKFGNVLVLKGDVVVTAAKYFPAAAGARRTVAAGETYEPPPVPSSDPGRAEALFNALSAALGDLAASDASSPEQPALRKTSTAALRRLDPLLPLAIAESLVFACAARLAERGTFRDADAAGACARDLLGRARAAVEEAERAADAFDPLFVYRDGGQLVQVHLVALAQFDRLAHEGAADVLPLLEEAAAGEDSRRAGTAVRGRRAALSARLEKRRTALTRDRDTLKKELAGTDDRDELRRTGEALYARAYEEPEGKAEAAALFKRYRKAGTKREHVARRLAELAVADETLAQLAWELERSDDASLDEVAEAIDRIERRKKPVRATSRKKKIDEIVLSDDARIFVGRSPRGNAELTFKTSRPDDWWFHARGIPGAHVVLRLDTAREAS